MFLPFHDDNPTRRTPGVTYALVAANVVAFLWFVQLSPSQRQNVTLHRGFIPARITGLPAGQPVVPDAAVRQDQFGRWWRPDRFGRWLPSNPPVQLPADQTEILLSLLTCMFLHAGWVHLLGNMWFLWLFGNNVEDRLGHVVFLLFYLVGGLLGSAAHWLIGPASTVPVIGASGAVAAGLGAYAITWPWARVHTLVFLVIFITVIDLPALGVLGVWFLLQLMQAQAQLGMRDVGGVASWAHVGGFVAGMAMMLLLGKLLRLGPPSTRQAADTTADQHDRIIDVQILDENDRRRPPRW